MRKILFCHSLCELGLGMEKERESDGAEPFLYFYAQKAFKQQIYMVDSPQAISGNRVTMLHYSSHASKHQPDNRLMGERKKKSD